MKTTSARLSAVLRNIAGCLCALQYCTLYSVYVYICIHYTDYVYPHSANRSSVGCIEKYRFCRVLVCTTVYICIHIHICTVVYHVADRALSFLFRLSGAKVDSIKDDGRFPIYNGTYSLVIPKTI